MKLIKKINSLITLTMIITTFNSYGMKRQGDQITPNEGEKISNFLLGDTELNPIEQIIFSLTNLPAEDASKIAALLFTNKSAKSLDIASKTINALAQTNKELNELINDPEFCLKLIKHLAIKFNCSDEEATEALQTQEADRRLELQQSLYNLIVSNVITEQTLNTLTSLCEKGADLEFIYWDEGVTYGNFAIELIPLAVAAIQSPQMIPHLLAHGANINGTNRDKVTALMEATMQRKIDGINMLVKYNNLMINQQDISGFSALSYALHFLLNYSVNAADISIIKILLDNGADTTIANNDGLTPLQELQSAYNSQDTEEERKASIQEAINLIHNAIAKKQKIE